MIAPIDIVASIFNAQVVNPGFDFRNPIDVCAADFVKWYEAAKDRSVRPDGSVKVEHIAIGDAVRCFGSDLEECSKLKPFTEKTDEKCPRCGSPMMREHRETDRQVIDSEWCSGGCGWGGDSITCK